ncbi:MAG: hypothetical protein AAF587_21405 [Bacteroidota bacterium]
MKKSALYITLLILFVISLVSCKKEILTSIMAGDDPNFRIVENDAGILKKFTRYVEVFGIKIFAVPEVADEKLLHAANVMAQYLDNDENGKVDNQKVLSSMIDHKAFMVMWKKEKDLRIVPPIGRIGQDLGDDETQPEFVRNGKTGRFDASLEEVLHIITHAGYAKAYPDIFGEQMGSQLAKAMDLARGGQFKRIPDSYPADAWYTYDDQTCGYRCMATEYHYWALTSWLGAQENRLHEIQEEWRLNTRAKLEAIDPAVVHLLTDPQYAFPTILPDGTYRH